MPDPADSDDSPAAPARQKLTVGFVAGVSPDKWARVWGERMALPLDLVSRGADLGGLSLDDVDMALARVTDSVPEGIHAIPLWTETPVVVAPKDHPIKVVDSVTLAELEDETIFDGQDDATLDLVAANVGVALMPQAVFRATGRRDVVGRPVADAEPTRIVLIWSGATDAAMDEFIGIVRGRGVNSSRGSADESASTKPAKKTAAAKAKAAEARAARAQDDKKKPARAARGKQSARAKQSGTGRGRRR